MPSDWNKPNGKRSYVQCSQIHNAIQAVLQGRMTVEKASAVFQVPKSTIYRRIQAINIEWDTYNNIVQTNFPPVHYMNEDVYYSSNGAYPSTSQMVYENNYYVPIKSYTQHAESEILTASKGLRKHVTKSGAIFKKSTAKNRTRNRANPLLLTSEIEVLTEHAYSLPQEYEIASQPIPEPIETPPPPLLYMGSDQSANDGVENSGIVDAENIFDSMVFEDDEQPLEESNPNPGLLPQRIRVLDGNGQHPDICLLLSSPGKRMSEFRPGDKCPDDKNLYKIYFNKLHYGLPLEMRLMGDTYVKDEFKRHKNCTQEQALVFLKEWTDYCMMLSKQLSTKGIVRGELGQNLNPKLLEKFEDEQLLQLFELKCEAEKWTQGKFDENGVKSKEGS